MKYVDWVDSVLAAVVAVEAETHPAYGWGLAMIVERLRVTGERAQEATWDALTDLDRFGWIEKSEHRIKLFQNGREAAAIGIRSGWPSVLQGFLTAEQEALLGEIVSHSEQQTDELAWLDYVVVGEDVATEVDPNRIWKLVNELAEAGYLDKGRVTAGSCKVFPTYAGVVRATERVNSELEELVEQLLPDWETTNVEFKRELHLDTNDQKAEFIRDVLALANTQVTGERYVVLGWDPMTHQFTTSIDPSVTQDRMENLLGHYTQPTLTVRLRPFTWRDGGTAAVLAVVRDRSKVPYRVRTRFAGEKRVIDAHDVYVRHGSHIAKADPDEIADLEAEALRARS